MGQDEPLPLYTLKSGIVEAGASISTAIGIDMPLSEASLDTERIALTPSIYKRDYFAEGQWPDRLPKVMQSVLLESLGERWGAAHVSRTGAGIQVGHVLQTEIQDFSVYNLNSAHPEVQLKIAFKILNLRSRNVLGGRVFFVKEPVCSTTMGGIVEALNKGLHTLLNEAMPWVESTVLK